MHLHHYHQTVSCLFLHVVFGVSSHNLELHILFFSIIHIFSSSIHCIISLKSFSLSLINALPASVGLSRLSRPDSSNSYQVLNGKVDPKSTTSILSFSLSVAQPSKCSFDFVS